MQAIRVTEPGGPEALQLADVPLPELGPGQVRIRVEAVGVNFIEVYQRNGQYKLSLPFTPGAEAAGVVDAIGPNVADYLPGQHVASVGVQGAYAEYAIVDAARLVPIPQDVDTRVAAAVMLQGMTAHYLTYSTFPLVPGQTALVHAAAGGVGQLLVQIAKRRGARVIGTAGSAEKVALAQSHGADAVINYNEQDFEAETRRLTNGAGVDVVYDSVGKATFDKSLNCLRPRGYLVLFGQSSGPV
jgi:NADPH2:quinone reductase